MALYVLHRSYTIIGQTPSASPKFQSRQYVERVGTGIRQTSG